MEECIEIAHVAGERIWNELGVPIYFYEAAAVSSDRIRLENVRRGQFEGLREAVLADTTKQPDIGGPPLHPSAGAAIVGARKILIAFNVNLNTTDLSVARAIAKRIRASAGGFPALKALGVPLPSRGLVQVAMNFTDFERTPVHVVYAEIARLAAAQGVEIAGAELIGLMPRRALEMAVRDLLTVSDFGQRSVLENCITDAIGGSLAR